MIFGSVCLRIFSLFPILGCRFYELLMVWLIIELFLGFWSIWIKECNWRRLCVLQSTNDEERQTIQKPTYRDRRLHNWFSCFDALFVRCTALLKILLHLYCVFIVKLCIIVNVVYFMMLFEYETIGTHIDEALFVGFVTLLTIGCVLMY